MGGLRVLRKAVREETEEEKQQGLLRKQLGYAGTGVGGAAEGALLGGASGALGGVTAGGINTELDKHVYHTAGDLLFKLGVLASSAPLGQALCRPLADALRQALGGPTAAA